MVFHTAKLLIQKTTVNFLRNLSMTVDFGKVASTYATYRRGLPSRFFDELSKQKIAIPGNKILDLGTGTGDIARNLALRGCNVTAIDPSEAMLEQAKKLSENIPVKINYQIATAERTNQPDNYFDAVTAVQAYHWFDPAKALPEIIRVLKPNGKLIIASYDWKSGGHIALVSEALVRKYNPKWTVIDFYKKPVQDLSECGFQDVTDNSFMQDELYFDDEWTERSTTFYGAGPALSDEKLCQYKKEAKQTFREEFKKEPKEACGRSKMPHKCHIITGTHPFFKPEPKPKSELIPTPSYSQTKRI